MATKRAHYFDHQFLVEADFTDEQKYHLEMRRRLNRVLHTFGIAEGLEVVKQTNKIVTVRPGVAIDRLGREMILEATQDVDLSAITTAVPAFITIAYDEQQTDPSTATGASGNTRFTEQPILQALTTTPPTDGSVIRLARIDLSAGGNVPGNPNDAFDGGVRQAAGPRGQRGLASIDGVSNPGGDVDLLPGAGITITTDQTNHRITIAAQGLVSVDGVSSPGGNVDLVQANAITIAPDDANNRITIGENHSGRTDNPHEVTAVQTGAVPASGRKTIDGETTFKSSVTFESGKTGYVVDRCVNSGGATLRTGDVVRLKGTPVARFEGRHNKIPIPEVTLADKENDTAVIGIVDCEATPGLDEPDTRTAPEDPTSIPDGGELYAVTLGTYAHCKADATEAPIEVGDLLTTSANPGHAKKATDPKIGSIIGKALEPLKEGTDCIAVFINIQ